MWLQYRLSATLHGRKPRSNCTQEPQAVLNLVQADNTLHLDLACSAGAGAWISRVALLYSAASHVTLVDGLGGPTRGEPRLSQIG